MRLLLAAALLVPAIALANGRPPLTNGVYFRPNDAQSVYIRSTFGLLISRDDGCTFRWVCERAIGYGGEFDPKYAVAGDGTIFATTFTGLRVSRDGGCTWATATADTAMDDPGRVADLWIDAIDIGPNGHVWIASAESASPNNVYRSTDNGVTFEPRGMLSPTVWWKSVKVAPSNALRVYVAGYQVAKTPTARLYRSDDAGDTWVEHPLVGEQPDPPTFQFGQTPIVYVTAIDPAQPDTVFVTSLAANPPNGDRLYRSVDGGITFREVLATTDSIRNAFYAADGSFYVATLGGGSFHSTDGGATFTPLAAPPQLGCLGQRSDGTLIGCGANWQPDFKAVARTTDGATWDKLFRFVELAGPLECPAGTTSATECDPMWPALRDLFGATGPASATCPLVPDLTPPKTGNGGCCSAGGSPASSFGFAGVVALVLCRPRTRRRRYSASRHER